ncbi:MAG: sigma-70 family RNA polymerase sigma factor [bacterium]
MDNQSIAKQKYSDFESEIIPHITLLKNYALLLTKDPDEADDLVQDTMLKAFRFFHNFQKGSNSKAWLYTIMKNSFINSYRKKSKAPYKLAYDDVQNFYEAIKAEEVKIRHYSDDIFNDVLNDEIINALTMLPDDSRTIIILCDIEGYTYEEISEFLNCPMGTVRSRLHRSRKILYAILYNYAVQNGYIYSTIRSVRKSEGKKMRNLMTRKGKAVLFSTG